MWARRAADKIKLDETQQRPHRSLTDDERAAADPLLRTDSLRALLESRDGSFAADAHALGLMATMDRVAVTGRLPRHVEILAAAPAFELLFHVPPPPPSFGDPTSEVAPHVWIDYLGRVARAAGHPIADEARTPEERDRLAWAGMLDDIADLLAQAAPGVSPEVRPAVEGTVRRLRAEAIGDRNWFAQRRQKASE